MPGKPITKAMADIMIEEYIGYMSGLGVDMNNQTQNVSLTASTLMAWLTPKMVGADELKIFMGLYPPGHPQAGRTTVILWPYKNGQPLPGPGINQRGADAPTPDGGGPEDTGYNDGSSGP